MLPQKTVEITQFLYHEARLLDNEEWRAWLALLAPDLHYWMPSVQARYRRAGGTTYDPQAMAFFDDTLEDMTRRVARFEEATVWAEDPPTRAAHVVSNIEVQPGAAPDEYLVESIVTLHRCRNDESVQVTLGRRRDVIRDTAAGLRIARRHVFLLETVLQSKNLNTFF